MTRDKLIGIIGLGYVGLPLAVAFAEKFRVIGFDINSNRIAELNSGYDSTNESDIDELMAVLKSVDSFYESAHGLLLIDNFIQLPQCDYYIITVPTPIDTAKIPDLSFLLEATKFVAKKLKSQDIVIYESTVYPGCTEEECVPILESVSGLVFNIDFFVGYSPERVSPGDTILSLKDSVKVTSGSSDYCSQEVDNLYKAIISAGTYLAPSIKVAEAAKAIENAQRDLNISFVNELSLIFDRLNIDTNDVLNAAATKINFVKYKPGLVGGHCISVDPYYLAFKSIQLGYHPEVILAGRRINDYMPQFVANKMIKLLVKKGVQLIGSKILILGITFKENCPDFRNTKVVDVYNELSEFGLLVDIYDPVVDKTRVENELNIRVISEFSSLELYSGILVAVGHENFNGLDIKRLLLKKGVIFDLKGYVDREVIDYRL